MREASQELEDYTELCHQKAREAGFDGPSAFRGMRTRYGTVEASEKLVLSDKFQSGLTWAMEKGLLDYTVEAAVLKFPRDFAYNPHIAVYAKFRINLAKAGVKL